MKESMFNVKKENEEELTVFNTRNRKIIKINKKVYYDLIKNDEYNELYEKGFLVETKRDEFNDFLFDFKSSIYNTRYMTITYLVTNKCNFRCVYCFEGEEIKNKIEEKLSIKSFEMIYKKIISESKAKVIDFNFFGGEPLLDIQYILDILQIVNSIENTKVMANIVTNGYLLDKKKINILKKAGITSFQITIDGTKEIHDKYRPLKNGNGTFDKIIENIIYILEANLELIININYCDENYKQIATLLKEFPEMIREKAYIKFNQLQNTINNQFLSNIRSNKVSVNILDYLFSVLKAEGYPDFDYELLEAGPCVAQLKNSIIIEPDGKISKCIYGIGNDELLLGNILENENEVKNAFRNCNSRKLEDISECKTCSYLPMCKGGCRRKSIEEKSKDKRLLCEKQKYAYLVNAILNYYS